MPKPLVMLRSSRSTRSAPFKNDDLVKVTKDVPSLPKFGRGYTGVVVSVEEGGPQELSAPRPRGVTGSTDSDMVEYPAPVGGSVVLDEFSDIDVDSEFRNKS